MATEISAVAKPYLSLFGRRKTAVRSKPTQEITIKKKRKPTTTNEYGFSKKRRIHSMDLFPASPSVDVYKNLGTISSGSYGIVYKVEHTKTGEIMAMKEEFDGLSSSTRIEIDILTSLPRHPSVVRFKEMAVDEYDGVYVVMEHVDTDLRKYMKKKGSLAMSEVKMLMKKLVEGVEFLHRNNVVHRDLKPSNVLVSEGGDQLRICDFGLSVRVGVDEEDEPLLGTLWYRAPEALLGGRCDSCAVDMWAVGCIFAEMVLNEVLFRGGSEKEQLHEMYCILGHHSSGESGWSSIGGAKMRLCESGFDLLKGLLCYDTSKRLTAEMALNHAWFGEGAGS